MPFYGFAVMCTDHPIVQRVVGRIQDRRIITYGENPQADVRLIDLDNTGGQSQFAVQFRDRAGAVVHTIGDLMLPMPGRHNALNATSAGSFRKVPSLSSASTTIHSPAPSRALVP